MTVKELITKLQQFDPNTKVYTKSKDIDNFISENEIKSVHQDMSSWKGKRVGNNWIGEQIVMIYGEQI